MERGKWSENKKVNRVKLFFILLLFKLKHPQRTSSLRKAVSSTSVPNHLLFCGLEILQGAIGKAGMKPALPLGLQPG